MVYGTFFVLFLATNEDKPHCNILNSMRAVIFCFIKLWEVIPKNAVTKISGAILDILDQKILIKNIQRFIGFDLIFRLVYIFKCFEKAKSFKIYGEKKFNTILAIFEHFNLEKGLIFGF